jgi:hypothetical protein
MSFGPVRASVIWPGRTLRFCTAARDVPDLPARWHGTRPDDPAPVAGRTGPRRTPSVTCRESATTACRLGAARYWPDRVSNTNPEALGICGHNEIVPHGDKPRIPVGSSRPSAHPRHARSGGSRAPGSGRATAPPSIEKGLRDVVADRRRATRSVVERRAHCRIDRRSGIWRAESWASLIEGSCPCPLSSLSPPMF